MVGLDGIHGPSVSITHIYLFICYPGPQLWHAGSLVATCGILFPDEGSNSHSLQWTYRASATTGEACLAYFLILIKHTGFLRNGKWKGTVLKTWGLKMFHLYWHLIILLSTEFLLENVFSSVTGWCYLTVFELSLLLLRTPGHLDPWLWFMFTSHLVFHVLDFWNFFWLDT